MSSIAIEELGGLAGGDKIRSFLESTENLPIRTNTRDGAVIAASRSLIVSADYEISLGGSLELSTDATLEII